MYTCICVYISARELKFFVTGMIRRLVDQSRFEL